MLTKAIRNCLHRKITSWLDSIDDPSVRAAAKKDVIVTGGAIVSLLQNEKPNDYDVYFKTQDTCFAVADYYACKFHAENKDTDLMVMSGDKTNVYGSVGSYPENAKDRVRIVIPSSGIAKHHTCPRKLQDELDDGTESMVEDNPQELLNDNYIPMFITSNAITLSNKIQIVIRFWGDAATIHSNYDFVHCMSYYDYAENKVTLHPEALESILNKNLVYRGSKYPLCSIIRTRKFIKRGWHINAGQYLKMCFQVSKLNLEDISVLEDQLVGVDSAYFSIMLANLKEHCAKHAGFQYTTEYVASIVDSIF